MNDRESLELAAKAAGIVGTSVTTLGGVPAIRINPHDLTPWNPLTDDGDALRLAVKLRIDLHTTPINADAVLVTAKHRMRSDLLRQPNPTQSAELYQPDPYAATRRAIVRAAAEIGRQMQEGGAA